MVSSVEQKPNEKITKICYDSTALLENIFGN